LPTDRFIPEIIPPRTSRKTDHLFLFRNREILVRRGGSGPVFPTFADLVQDEAAAGPRFIGGFGDDLCFAMAFDHTALPDGFAFENLRTVYLDSAAVWRPAMSTAVLVVEWDANHKYCGRCGTETAVAKDEWCRKCPSCDQPAYPRISPAVIVAILRDGKILLAHNKRFNAPIYSLIAGFVEPGEFLEDAVRREVLEETAIEVTNIRYFGSQSWPFPNSLMIGFVAEYVSGSIVVNDELSDASWYGPDSMPEIPGHGSISRRIIDWYLDTGGDGALPGDEAR
jgi:NAD+ diphosphatase